MCIVNAVRVAISLRLGERRMNPIGPSPLLASSHVIISAPLFLYALEPVIMGTTVFNQLSPCLIWFRVGEHELCISSHRFGVMNA
jgi:hypothetical protein